jgi:hypothetical protein
MNELLLLRNLLWQVPATAQVSVAFGCGNNAAGLGFLVVEHHDGTEERLTIPDGSLRWLAWLFPRRSWQADALHDADFKVYTFRFSVSQNALVAKTKCVKLCAWAFGIGH